VVARGDLVDAVERGGGFAHGHTHANNPLAAACGLAVLGELRSTPSPTPPGRASACSTVWRVSAHAIRSSATHAARAF
jgi:adenosylmethionine-8-amino-7-oxononanoate aminotransferase